MHDQSAWNMYIFRDGRTKKAGSLLLNDVIASLRALGTSQRSEQVLDPLLRAGELECALADAGSPFSHTVEHVTDLLASALVASESGGEWHVSENDVVAEMETVQMPASVMVSTPEGFAYYALHPLGYVDLLASVEVTSACAAVIGIRSIGTTLSAVVRAGLSTKGIRVGRSTVRPTGHPYNRHTDFTSQQKEWIAQQRVRGAQFFVVDEGPGMSGSSFLSVGDALLSEGIEKDKITFLCSRVPDPNLLTADDAANRWPAFRALYVAPNWRLPSGADQFIAGRIWRKRVFGDERNWPASWTQMERLKFLSTDCSRLLKFEGFGRFGSEVQNRARTVGDGGFGPAPVAWEQGFSIYPVVEGESLLARHLSAEVIMRIAHYCAFRARMMPANAEPGDELERMMRFNFHEEFGSEVVSSLEVQRPVIADGRMLPHKWLRDRNGVLLKVDNASHGDGHFFPGPTDIAWDLAGAIVEWGMDKHGIEALLNAYSSESGDDASQRLPGYLLAYSVFRMGYCKMAAEAMSGSAEKDRLACEYERYRMISSELFQQNHGSQDIKRLIPRRGEPLSSTGQVNQWA